MGRTSQDALAVAASAVTLVQLPIMLTLIAYYRDPLFSMYTTNLRNITTQEMEVEVEDFSASALYLLTSAATALFALASQKVELDVDTFYVADTMDELPMWDLSFWAAMAMQHACIVAFMCSPVDWYFLVLMVVGISLMVMLLAQIPLGTSRSRENLLMLTFALLFLMLYSAVRRHSHGGFFASLLIMDSLVLVGHTFDAPSNMQTVGNCRLCYTSGMSAMLLASYLQ